MSQNTLGSFRREAREGLMVRKGARPSGEKEENRRCHRQGARNGCPGRKRAHCPTIYLPEDSPHWGVQNGRQLRKLRKEPEVGSKQVRIKPGCVELSP